MYVTTVTSKTLRCDLSLALSTVAILDDITKEHIMSTHNM